MSGHVVPPRIYVGVFLVLIGLTALTVFVAGIDLGRMNTAAALAIATAKASLVVLFFMHVKYGSRLTRIFVAAGLIWLGLLIFITMTDYLSRGWAVG